MRCLHKVCLLLAFCLLTGVRGGTVKTASSRGILSRESGKLRSRVLRPLEVVASPVVQNDASIHAESSSSGLLEVEERSDDVAGVQDETEEAGTDAAAGGDNDVASIEPSTNTTEAEEEAPAEPEQPEEPEDSAATGGTGMTGGEETGATGMEESGLMTEPAPITSVDPTDPEAVLGLLGTFKVLQIRCAAYQESDDPHETCVRDPACGWCRHTRNCLPGTKRGPHSRAQPCMSYNWLFKEQTGKGRCEKLDNCHSCYQHESCGWCTQADGSGECMALLPNGNVDGKECGFTFITRNLVDSVQEVHCPAYEAEETPENAAVPQEEVDPSDTHDQLELDSESLSSSDSKGTSVVEEGTIEFHCSELPASAFEDRDDFIRKIRVCMGLALATPVKLIHFEDPNANASTVPSSSTSPKPATPPAAAVLLESEAHGSVLPAPGAASLSESEASAAPVSPFCGMPWKYRVNFMPEQGPYLKDLIKKMKNPKKFASLISSKAEAVFAKDDESGGETSSTSGPTTTTTTTVVDVA